MKSLGIYLSVFFFLSHIVQAGVKLKYKSSDKEMMNMSFNSNFLKMEFNDGKDQSEMIYNGKTGDIMMVDHIRKNYSVFTKKDQEKARSMMREMKKNLQVKMKNMPENVRKMMEKRMGSMKPKKKKSYNIKKIKSGVKINKWKTTLYKVYEDKKHNGNIWLASYKTLNLSKDDFNIFMKMSKAMKSLSGNKDDDAGIYGFASIWSKTPGVAVRFLQKEEDKPMDLALAKKVQFKKSFFKAPAKYKKNKFFAR